MEDRGFRYGQHLFESIAVRNGSPLLETDHRDLLESSAKRKDIPFPRSLAAALGSFCKSVKLRDGMLRIYLTAGSGLAGAPVTRPSCYVSWEATRFPTDADISAGYRLVTLRKAVDAGGWGEKCGNYETHLAAFVDARKAGADEGIVLDGGGRVLSCAMGNILAWLPSRTGPVLCTPPAESGPRTGAVLGWVSRKRHVRERILRIPDLRRAVAMAVTNSRLGVMPVTSLDGKPLPDPSPALVLADDYLRSHGLHGGA